MPCNEFTYVKDANPKEIVSAFKRFMKEIYDAQNIVVDDMSNESANVSLQVPGRLSRAEFEDDMAEFCDKYNCSYELVDLAPEAPSRQYFSENMKLMYPDVKSWEILKKNPQKLGLAKELWKKNWEGVPFDENNPDDQEDIVILYNMYMEELREWKPVEVKLIFNKKEEGEN